MVVGNEYSCTSSLGAQTASDPASQSSNSGNSKTVLADWAIAIIIVGCVIVLVAIILLVIYRLRYTSSRRDEYEERLDSGEYSVHPQLVIPHYIHIYMFI